MNEFKLALINYTNFSGRATRREYWMFSLFYMIFCFIAGILGVVLASVTNSQSLALVPIVVLILALIIPSLAVTVRRLHDVNKSGWIFLIQLIPVVGVLASFYLLYLFCIEGNPNANQWGASRNTKASNSF